MQLPPPNIRLVPLASNLITIPKHTRFLMRSLQLSLFNHQSSSTGYCSNADCVTYHIKLSYKSNRRLLTISNIYHKITLTLKLTCGSTAPPGMKSNDLTIYFHISVLLKIKHENPIIFNTNNM